MKKIFCVLLFVILVFPVFAFAGENHLLWNIEWGHEPKEIVSILKEEKGIPSEITMDKETFGLRFWLVESSEDPNITILGYPVKIYWRLMMEAEQAECQFNQSVDTDECYSTIIGAMQSNFGNPTKILLRIFSAGFSAWNEKTADNIYDVVDLTGTDLSKLNFKEELAKYDYVNDDTYAILDVTFDNVECRYLLDSGVYTVDISYGNKKYVEDYMDYPEPTHEEYKLTKYQDTGF